VARVNASTLFHYFIHAVSLFPLAWLVWDSQTGGLTANPVQALAQRTGRYALTFLVASLACTPANAIFAFRAALKERRTLGMYAFFYAVLHVLTFAILDYNLVWKRIWPVVLEKRFILVGALAFVILAILALTSFQAWQKLLGRNWKRLHRLVYLAAPLAILHFAWAVKGNIFRLTGDIAVPLSYAALVVLLLALRLAPVRCRLVNWRGRFMRAIFGGWHCFAGKDFKPQRHKERKVDYSQINENHR
jgi:sulfoxide reductase heme-binding subunit YedZ